MIFLSRTCLYLILFLGFKANCSFASSSLGESLSSGQTVNSIENFNKSKKISLGLGLTQTPKAHQSGETSVEIMTYYFIQLNSVLTLRPGIRFGGAFNSNSEKNTARSIFIKEKDLKSTFEISLLTRYYFLMPVLTLGGGTIFRSTTLNSDSRFISKQDSKIEGNSVLGFLQYQFSLLLPLNSEQIQLGPFVRNSQIFKDKRTDWQFGLEGSFKLF